jgi:hypothetical protein
MARTMVGFPLAYLWDIRKQLAGESDRGRLVLAGICIEELLKAKFMNEGVAPRTLFQMLKHARAVGWMDEDIFHDGEIIRGLRNRCAHDGSAIEINAEDIRSTLERFQVPKRRYYDWGKIRAATTPNGFVMYNGERPAHAQADLHVPGRMTFEVAIGVILLVLAANLEVPFATGESGTVAILDVPEFMKL